VDEMTGLKPKDMLVEKITNLLGVLNKKIRNNKLK